MTSSIRLAIRCSVFLAMAPAFSWAGAGANGCGKAGLASGTYTMADRGVSTQRLS